MKRLLCVFVIIWAAVGCVEEQPDCFRSTDCPAGAFCEAGRCAVHIIDDGFETTHRDYTGPVVVAPSDAGAGNEDESVFEYDCPKAAPGDLQIEEILSDVPSGPDGDANGDGVRDAYDDEFVEISNGTTRAVGLRGIALRVNDVDKFRFDAAECLEPMQVLVVFAGGPEAPGRRVAGKRLGLANGGGTVTLTTSDGSPLVTATYGDGAVGSWVRQPAVRGEFARHGQLSNQLFSPGVCPDGSPWDAQCAAATVDAADGGYGD